MRRKHSPFPLDFEPWTWDFGLHMSKTFTDLVALMDRLRSPGGCPWDREQTYATLVRRHPHVFGDTTAGDSAAVLRNWEAIKAEEKRAAGKLRGDAAGTSILDGVSTKAPALMEAHQLSTKAARVGFDWQRVEDIFDKLQEEIDELRVAISTHADTNTEAAHTRVREEIGGLLFVVTNIARHMQVEPEAALKLTNRKFRRRFGYIESKLSERNRKFAETTLDELEELWQEAKATQQ